MLSIVDENSENVMRIACMYFPHGNPEVGSTSQDMVVIDTLRMTSVAITALHHRCRGVKCLVKIDDALDFKEKMPEVLLGGEREGQRIPGFSLGNSPLEYTPAAVSGKWIALTTTNGTRAIDAAQKAHRLLLGAFLNAGAVAEALLSSTEATILCAGTDGKVSLEDVLAAGAILERLQRKGVRLAMDDAAQLALRAYLEARDDLDAALCTTTHYRRLAALGPAFREDIAYCLQEDVVRTVPVLREGWFQPLDTAQGGSASLV